MLVGGGMTIGAGLSFRDLIGKMTFEQFAVAFGTLWRFGGPGEDEPEVRKYRPWRLWRGVDGEPGQDDVARMLPEVQLFRSPKARQKGMTEMWSLYCAYVLMKEDNVNAKAFGSDSKQTKEIMELRFKTKIEGFSAVYPKIPWPKWEIGVERADCEEMGTYFQVYSSENTGAHGGSPRLTLFDEAQNYANVDFKEMMKGIGPSLRGANQLAVLGTARSGSAFNDFIDAARNRTPEVRKNVWRSGTDSGMIFLCDSLDPEHRVPGWKESRLHDFFAGDEIAFKSQHPDTIDDMFASHEGLVISSWNAKRHVVELPVVWKPHHEFYLFYDHGSTPAHPAVAGLLQYDPWTDFLYCFDEVFERGKELSVVARLMKEKVRDWRREWDNQGQEIKPALRTYGDVRGRYGMRQVDEILRDETGWQFIAVHKRDEAAQIELTKARFFRGTDEKRTGGIGFSPRCRNIIKQISSLRYKDGKDEPEGLENDAFDMIKYATHQIHVRPPTPEPTWEELHHARVQRWVGSAPRAPAAAATAEDAAAAALRCG